MTSEIQEFLSVVERFQLLPAERQSALAAALHASNEPPGQLAVRSGLLSAQELDVVEALRHPDTFIPGYELLGRLGMGGMGVVYRARQLAFDRTVALKTVLVGASANPTALARFEQEAKTLGRLTHPHLVTAYDFGRHAGRLYLAMEYLQGENADDLVSRVGPLPESMAWGLIRQAATGLAYAAESSIIHRDVKPPNLMLVPAPMGYPLPPGMPLVKVADFGLALLADAPDDRTRLTSEHLTVGSPHYMAPEQFAGSQVAIQADMYGLGATAYELLTGSTPFGGLTLAQIIARKLHGRPDPIASSRPDVHPLTVSLLDDLLSVDIAQRPVDYHALITRLDELLAMLHSRDARPTQDTHSSQAAPAPSGLRGTVLSQLATPSSPRLSRSIDSSGAAGSAEPIHNTTQGTRLAGERPAATTPRDIDRDAQTQPALAAQQGATGLPPSQQLAIDLSPQPLRNRLEGAGSGDHRAVVRRQRAITAAAALLVLSITAGLISNLAPARRTPARGTPLRQAGVAQSEPAATPEPSASEHTTSTPGVNATATEQAASLPAAATTATSNAGPSTVSATEPAWIETDYVVPCFDGQTLNGWKTISGAWQPGAPDEDGGKVLAGMNGLLAYPLVKPDNRSRVRLQGFRFTGLVTLHQAAAAELQFGIDDTDDFATSGRYVVRISAEHVELGERAKDFGLLAKTIARRALQPPGPHHSHEIQLVSQARQFDVLIDGERLSSVPRKRWPTRPELVLAADAGQAWFHDLSLQELTPPVSPGKSSIDLRQPRRSSPPPGTIGSPRDPASNAD
jgi:serine/threonine protein kinase